MAMADRQMIMVGFLQAQSAHVQEVADRLEELFSELVCDGFVVGATHVPGGYADFVDYVVPELQRRGLYHAEYTGGTLRDNLGLPRPRVDTSHRFARPQV
jgi:hypothetical protein